MTWVTQARVSVLRTFPDGFHGLGTATRDLVLLSTFSIESLKQESLLLPLDNSSSPTVFPDADLTRAFRLLDPRFLYNLDDLKFYRLQPPLTRTAIARPSRPSRGTRSGITTRSGCRRRGSGRPEWEGRNPA